MLIDPVRVEGLREFQAGLKRMDGETQKMLRVVLNDAVELVLAEARPRVPARTGRARASLKPSSSQREARISAGGNKAPHYPWLDFGGKVGRGRTGPKTGSVDRLFIKQGRYLYPAYSRVHPAVQARLEEGLVDLAKTAGLEVS